MNTNPFATNLPKAKLPAGSYKKATVTDIYDDGNIRLEAKGKVVTIPVRARQDRRLNFVTAEGHKDKNGYPTAETVASIIESIQPQISFADITLKDEVSEKDGKTYANVISAKFYNAKK